MFTIKVSNDGFLTNPKNYGKFYIQQTAELTLRNAGFCNIVGCSTIFYLGANGQNYFAWVEPMVEPLDVNLLPQAQA